MTVQQLFNELQKLIEEGKGHWPVLIHDEGFDDYTTCFELLFQNRQVYLG